MTALHPIVASYEDGLADCNPESVRLASHRSQPSFSNGFIERLRPIVEGAVRRVASTKDPQYEDLMQNALLGVIAALDASGFRDEPPPRWVEVVARNTVLDELRARVRERRVFTSGSGDDAPAQAGACATEPEHLSHVRGELRRLDGALRKLGPQRAVVLYLHDMFGYELAEIADMIGTSVAAAQSRLVRGRRAVIRDLSE
jgi:RNA polymerase sigma-70 factor (ECF subfamily)